MAHALARRRSLPKPSPQADPRFNKVMGKIKQGAARTKKHPAAAIKAAQASAAAKGPVNEKAAGAKSNQVDKIQGAPAQKPENTSFLALLRSEIQAAMPKTLGDTENFMKGDTPDQMKGSLKGSVGAEKDKAAGAVKGASEATPNEAGVAAKPVTPIPGDPAPQAPSVDGANAMPAPKTDADVSLQDSKQDTDDEMKDAHVTPTQLRKANDSRFSAVLTAKDAVAKQADAAPAKYRAGEKGILVAAASQAMAQGHAGAAAMVGIRGKSNSAVLTRQAAAKAKEEAARKEVTDHIELLYNNTKSAVETRLSDLETEVNSIFDVGIEAALKTMTSFVEQKMDEYKGERYSGVLGGGRWLKDKLFGLPHDADVFYTQGRTVFTQSMDNLVVRVASLVERRLKEAKNEVAKGKNEIAKYVAGLAPNLKTVGKAAEKEMAGRFAELEQGIEDKKNQLAQGLAQKYKDSFDKANEALKKIQDENKGLVTAFVEKLGEIVKMLLEFKDKLMALLKKAADVIGLIVDDPIGFLGNLIAAIKLGVQQFVSNIWTHLKNGFMKWLFGSLATAGIEIPGDFSLPSILKLVLSVLGITYERMRAKAVKLIGERAVKFIEKVVEYIKELVTGGPAALWAKVKEDLGNLKEMVIDAIQSWLVETIVKKAIAKLVLLFNPVGAIVQAILAIYDVVTFLIDKATQIMALVESVIDSVAMIVAGNIGAAANKIEQSLADTIPLVIGFLADFIGLGGITKKIKEIITKVQTVVDKAIDKAIAKVVGFVKRLFGGGKSEDQKENALDDALTASDAALAKFAGKPVGRVVLKPILAAIRIRYRLTALELVQEGDVWAVKATINPSKKKNTLVKAMAALADKLKPSEKIARQDLRKALAELEAARKKSHSEFGDAQEAVKKAELQLRAALGEGIAIPTRGKGLTGRGFDSAFLVINTKEKTKPAFTLEQTEIKASKTAGKTMPLFARRSGDTKVPPGKESILVPEGTTPLQAIMKGANAEKVATGQAALVRAKGRPIENKFSAITENYETNFRRMIDAVIAAGLPPEFADLLQKLKKGLEGVTIIVVEMRQGTKFSVEASDAAEAMLAEVVKKLRSEAEGAASNIQDAEIRSRKD